MALLGGENRVLTQRGIVKIMDLTITDKIVTVDGSHVLPVPLETVGKKSFFIC